MPKNKGNFPNPFTLLADDCGDDLLQSTQQAGARQSKKLERAARHRQALGLQGDCQPEPTRPQPGQSAADSVPAPPSVQQRSVPSQCQAGLAPAQNSSDARPADFVDPVIEWQRQLLLQYGAAAVRESADSALDLASSSSTSFGAPDNTEFQFWESASYDSGASGSAAYSEWEVWPEAPKEDWPSLPQPAPKPALLGWKPVRSSRVKRTNGVKVLNRASESFGYTYAGPVTCNEELEQQGYQRLMRDEGSWQAGPLLEAERQRQIAVAQQLHEREVLRHPTAADMHSMMDRASGRPTEADASDFVMSTCASSSGRQLMRQMMDAGWHPVFPSSGIGNSHPKWKRRLPNGTLQVITHSSSPSDVRAMAHLQAALARADRAAQEAHQEASPANC